MAVMVGRWDCPYCGNQGNLGSDTKCKACGVSRGPDVEFYLPEDAEYTTDEAMLKRAAIRGRLELRVLRFRS